MTAFWRRITTFTTLLLPAVFACRTRASTPALGSTSCLTAATDVQSAPVVRSEVFRVELRLPKAYVLKTWSSESGGGVPAGSEQTWWYDDRPGRTLSLQQPRRPFAVPEESPAVRRVHSCSERTADGTQLRVVSYETGAAGTHGVTFVSAVRWDFPGGQAVQLVGAASDSAGLREHLAIARTLRPIGAGR